MGETKTSISERLPDLLDLIRNSDIRELEIEEGDMRLRLRRSTNGSEPSLEDVALVEEVAESVPATLTVTAPMVGTFFSSSRPDAPPFVSPGSLVEDDTVVGIVEALNVLTQVEAGCRGTVRAKRVEDGQAVEYGQVLFEVEPGG